MASRKIHCSSGTDGVDKTRTVGNWPSRGGAAKRENKTTTTKAHSKCCQCQANRRCVRCQCVQEGRRCVDCYPGRNSPSTCANQSTALASASQPAVMPVIRRGNELRYLWLRHNRLEQTRLCVQKGEWKLLAETTHRCSYRGVRRRRHCAPHQLPNVVLPHKLQCHH